MISREELGNLILDYKKICDMSKVQDIIKFEDIDFSKFIKRF